jgi:aminoglycoside phosphotransferase family enzyme/predicted kinase
MSTRQFDQAKLFQDLEKPQAYDPAPRSVERIDTHASAVFLAGPFAYKVKQAVKYPFLDFSTLEKRHAALLNELRINRRTAPDLYLEIAPITAGKGGTFSLGGAGEAIEWALRMRRFEQDKLYDHLAEKDELDAGDMARLAETIADFHATADRLLTPSHATAPLAAILRDNAQELAACADAFPPEDITALARASEAMLGALIPLLRSRAAGGYVRHCHGDLHLRNIVEIEGKPVLFDAIEFDDTLATIDVLYDLAFLLMDLGRRGLAAHANAMLNAYLDREGSSGNLLGLAALPLFLSMRAVVRAKVELLRSELLRAERIGGDASACANALVEAKTYFDLARAFLMPAPARLIAIGGLSGSGKSAVARAIALHVGPFPGAVHIRSDVERKRLFGAGLGETLPARAYAPEVSDTVYAICRKRALLALAAGPAVILDAVHAKPAERAEAAELARQTGVPFTGLWLEAPRAVMRKRVAGRKGDVSDATPPVVDIQLGYDLGSQDFAVIDASRPLDEVTAACLQRIGQ